MNQPPTEHKGRVKNKEYKHAYAKLASTSQSITSL